VRKHRLPSRRPYSILAVSLWLVWPACAWSQSITSTIAVGSAPEAAALNKVTNRLYVANYVGRSITVIDGATHATSTIAIGIRTHAVAVNEATNKIYVVNIGDNGPFGSGIQGAITVIDGATNSAATVMDPNANGPFSVAVNQSTNKIYVGNYWSGNVTVVDGATNATATVTDPNAKSLAAYAVAVNPTTNKIYVANANNSLTNGSGNVTVIDGATNSTTTVTDSNAIGPNAVAVNATTNKIYVTNGGAWPAANHGNVTVIDGITNSTATITDANALFPQAVAVNQTTNKIYVANANNAAASWIGVVTVIDGATNATTTVTDPNAQDPGAVAVDEATNTIYVANGGCIPGPGNGCNNPGSNPGSITVISGATSSASTVIDPQANAPEAIAINPMANQVYIANTGSGNVTLIDGAGVTTTHTLGVLLNGTGTGTVTSVPVGINCGTTCQESVAAGTAVTLGAMSSSGSGFAGWSGPCSGTGSCDLVANTDQFVTATFNTTAPMQVPVPNVVGQTQAAASTAITGVGLAVGTVTQQSSSSVASGYVVSESPAAGTNVASGSAVNLVVSSGSPAGQMGGGYGGGGASDSLTLGVLLGVLMVSLRRIPHRSARLCFSGRAPLHKWSR